MALQAAARRSAAQAGPSGRPRPCMALAPSPLPRTQQNAHRFHIVLNCAAPSDKGGEAGSSSEGAASGAEPGPSGQEQVISGSELPEALQGLEINEDGLLIDTKTGKARRVCESQGWSLEGLFD